MLSVELYCTRCGALPEEPCRQPSGKSTRPHRERERAAVASRIVKIQVKLDSGNTLTFEAPGDVELEDRAECASYDYWNRSTRYRTGTVVALESDYAGACNKVRLLR